MYMYAGNDKFNFASGFSKTVEGSVLNERLELVFYLLISASLWVGR